MRTMKLEGLDLLWKSGGECQVSAPCLVNFQPKARHFLHIAFLWKKVGKILFDLEAQKFQHAKCLRILLPVATVILYYVKRMGLHLQRKAACLAEVERDSLQHTQVFQIAQPIIDRIIK